VGNSPWTAEEDAALRAAWAAGGWPAARGAGLRRTDKAVKCRAFVLGLRHPARIWTATEDAHVRAHYGRTRAADIAAALGRGVQAVHKRARALGADSGRRWTAAECEAMRLRYRSAGAAALARELLGAAGPLELKAVYGLAVRLGLTAPVRHPAGVYDRVRELHARGLTDAAIAREMADYFAPKTARERVTAIRARRLKLPRNGWDRGAAVARQHATLGIAHPAELRSRAHSAFAARYGLPADLTVRQVQIVVRLSRGPATVERLRADLGIRSMLLNRPKGASTRPDPGVHGTYLSDLERRGLVASIGLGTRTGPRRSYSLTPLAMDLLAGAPTPDPEAPK